MKKISLNPDERVSLMGLLIEKSKKGIGLLDLRIIWKILDRIEIKEEVEKKAMGYKKTEMGGFTWSNKNYTIDVELNDDQINMIKMAYADKDKEKKFSIVDGRGMISVYDKITEGEKDET